MTKLDLKTQIIDRVKAIEDEGVLYEIYNLIRLDTEELLPYKLTSSERKAIELGLLDKQEGKLFSSSEANALIQQWRNK